MSPHLTVRVELDREEDGRWIADLIDIPGVLVYGSTEEEALAKVKIMALQIVTDRLVRGEDPLTGHALGGCSTNEYLAAFAGLDFAPVTLAV